MTVYGGQQQPVTPPPKPDPLLLGALVFLVVALIVGIVFGAQAFTSDSPKPRPAAAGSTQQPETGVPAQSAPPSAPPTSASQRPSPTPSATPAKPPLVPARPSLLRASHSGLCLQANEGNGAGATQLPCDGNNPTELWVPSAVNGSQDTFQFVNAKDNRCLDVPGGSKDNGPQIAQFDCNAGPSQQWRLVRDGDGFRLVSVNSGRCVGVDGGSPNPGAAAKQWDCDGSPNQRWQFPQ